MSIIKLTDRIRKTVTILKKEYSKYRPPSSSEWYSEPYQILISCIISLRTKDEITTKAARALFKLAKTPKQMVQLPLDKIRKAIYPAGFYITKAKRIKEMSKIILNEYGERVPDEIDELLKLPGVGRKTANIVITYGYKKSGIAVDTHVHRIPNRLGWIETKNPEQTEFALMEIVPKKDWIAINDLLVVWGQNICKPVSPRCDICKIRQYCDRVDVKTKYV